MENAALKKELKEDILEIIEHAESKQLKEIYDLLTNHFNNKSFDNWDSMPEPLKQKIDKSIEQANSGLGTPAKEAIKRVREKYGLNG